MIRGIVYKAEPGMRRIAEWFGWPARHSQLAGDPPVILRNARDLGVSLGRKWGSIEEFVSAVGPLFGRGWSEHISEVVYPLMSDEEERAAAAGNPTMVGYYHYETRSILLGRYLTPLLEQFLAGGRDLDSVRAFTIFVHEALHGFSGERRWRGVGRWPGTWGDPVGFSADDRRRLRSAARDPEERIEDALAEWIARNVTAKAIYNVDDWTRLSTHINSAGSYCLDLRLVFGASLSTGDPHRFAYGLFATATSVRRFRALDIAARDTLGAHPKPPAISPEDYQRTLFQPYWLKREVPWTWADPKAWHPGKPDGVSWLEYTGAVTKPF